MKYVEQKEKVIQQLPNKEILQITVEAPNLQFNVETTAETNEFQEHLQTPLEGAEEVMEILETSKCDQKFHG